MDDEDGYFGEQAAARYDESSADMFDPGAVEPVVEVLAGLAGGWAMRRVEELHDHRDRSGCRQDEVSRGGRLGEADIATREQGPQWRLRCRGHLARSGAAADVSASDSACARCSFGDS
jgi:hypothetical protein